MVVRRIGAIQCVISAVLKVRVGKATVAAQIYIW